MTEIMYTECAYRLAAAMYKVAEREAAGEMGHWSSDLAADQLWRKQQDAHDFCQEWREYFAQRLVHPEHVEPLPAPSPRPVKPKAKGGRRPKGQPSVFSRTADFLREHGPATASEIADAVSCGYANATHMLRSHPGIFRIAGEHRNGSVVATLWDVKRQS